MDSMFPMPHRWNLARGSELKHRKIMASIVRRRRRRGWHVSALASRRDMFL
jgi:hypothetical protein